MNYLAITSIIAPFLFIIAQASAGAEEVVFGTLRLELSSKSTSEARILTAELLGRTSSFLDKQFQTYFSDNISEDYFSHNDLGVTQFDLVKVQDSLFSSTIEFEGSTFFKTVPIPSKSLIVGLVKDAFQGSSRLEYIRDLQLSDTQFLIDISQLIVGLNDQIIAAEDLTRDGPASETPSSAQFWTEERILLIAGISAAVLAACSVALAWCYCRRNKGNSKLKVTTTTSNQGSLEEDPESPNRSPSPVHSICSQESSKFTYNPRSLYTSTSSISALTMDTKTATSSHFSAINVDIDAGIDMALWTQQNTISPMTPAPFGNDISAIEKTGKDLSLVVEASDEDYTPGSLKTNRSSLTQDALRDLDDKLLNVSWNQNNGSMHSEEDMAYEVSTPNDVIRDLNNLSQQIDKHRASSQPLSSATHR